MYARIWQVTRTEDSFVATETRSGTFDGKEFFKYVPTKSKPITADTLEELRAKLKMPPYSVFGLMPGQAIPPVIEEWF